MRASQLKQTVPKYLRGVKHFFSFFTRPDSLVEARVVTSFATPPPSSTTTPINRQPRKPDRTAEVCLVGKTTSPVTVSRPYSPAADSRTKRPKPLRIAISMATTMSMPLALICDSP